MGDDWFQKGFQKHLKKLERKNRNKITFADTDDDYLLFQDGYNKIDRVVEWIKIYSNGFRIYFSGKEDDFVTYTWDTLKYEYYYPRVDFTKNIRKHKDDNLKRRKLGRKQHKKTEKILRLSEYYYSADDFCQITLAGSPGKFDQLMSMMKRSGHDPHKNTGVNAPKPKPTKSAKRSTLQVLCCS